MTRLLTLVGCLALCSGLAACFELRTDASELQDQPGVVGPCPYEAAEALIDVGECRIGMLVNWEDETGELRTSCIGEVLPSKELCNGLDDDCDGATDNHGACATDDLNLLGPPGGIPFSVLADDRVGPALIKHPRNGVLQDCKDAESPLACARRFVAEQGASWGVSAESGVLLIADEDDVVAAAGLIHVGFEQRYVGPPETALAAPGLAVPGGSMSVHLRHGTPHAVLGVTARVLPVRADVPTEATVGATDAAAALGRVISGEPELVIFARWFDPESGQRLDQEDPGQTQHLAWQATVPLSGDAGGHETLWITARGEPIELGASHGRLHDVGVQVGAGDKKVWPFPAEPGASGPGGASNDQTFVAETALAALGAVDAVDDPGALSPAWRDVTITWDPAAGDCQLAPDVLGWIDAAEPSQIHVCQEAATLGESLADAVRHELMHAVVQRAGKPPLQQADDDEGEAVRHGLVEAMAEAAQCAGGAGCGWVHSGRDFNTFTNPGEQGCDAKIEVDVAQGGFQLCKGASESNRAVVGHALRVASCTLISGCTAAACATDGSSCGSEPEQQAAASSLLGVMVAAVSGGFMPGLSLRDDLSTGMVQACLDLVQYGNGGAAGVDGTDCAELQAAFTAVGIAKPCGNLAPDVCDGKDNDCDGFTDNPVGVLADHSLTRDCTGWDTSWTSGEGICVRGLELCIETGPQTAMWSGPDSCGDFSDHVPGEAEVCDLIDNDCDGLTDEGLTASYRFDGDGDGYWTPLHDPQWFCPDAAPEQGGPPSAGWRSVDELTAGGDCDDSDAEEHPGVVEDCDGVDDNCDGEAQAAGCPCELGDPPEPCGPANEEPDGCLKGARHCLPLGVDGALILADECQGAQYGEAELCDGVDNDCDGATDDGLADLGPCGLENTGTVTCEAGSLSCQGETAPNACGGTADLGANTPGVACGEGVDAGHWVCTSPNETTCVSTTGPQTSGATGELLAYGHVRYNSAIRNNQVIECEAFYSQGIAGIDTLPNDGGPDSLFAQCGVSNPGDFKACRLWLETPVQNFQPTSYYVSLTAVPSAEPAICQRKGDHFIVAFHNTESAGGSSLVHTPRADFLVFKGTAP